MRKKLLILLQSWIMKDKNLTDYSQNWNIKKLIVWEKLN